MLNAEAGDDHKGVKLGQLLNDDPGGAAMAVPDAPPHPVVCRLRPEPNVLHGCMSLGHDFHGAPVLPQGQHDLLGQIGLAGAGKPEAGCPWCFAAAIRV